MAKKEKKEVTTLQHLRRWKAANIGMRIGMYACPVVPTAVVMGINWNEWFCTDTTRGWSIGMGFAMLLTVFFAAVVAVMKKDEFLKSKVGPMLSLAVAFVVIGFACKLLASIWNELGNYFLYVGISLFGSFGFDAASTGIMQKQVAFYQGLVEENGLTTSSEKKKLAREQAAREAAEREARRRAVE